MDPTVKTNMMKGRGNDMEHWAAYWEVNRPAATRCGLTIWETESCIMTSKKQKDACFSASTL